MHRPGQRFAFIMDTAPCHGAEELAEAADLLVVESTFADEEAHLAAEYGHLTAGAAGRLAATAGVDTVVLTHFSARYDDLEFLRSQARARAGASAVLIARDLDRIPVPPRRRGRPA